MYICGEDGVHFSFVYYKPQSIGAKSEFLVQILREYLIEDDSFEFLTESYNGLAVSSESAHRAQSRDTFQIP